MNDFRDLSEVLNHREDMVILHLFQYAKLLDKDFLEMLISPEDGIYFEGNIFPTFYADRKYYKRSDITIAPNGAVIYHKEIEKIFYHSPPISNVMDIPRIMEDIYDDKGNIVMTARDIFRLRKYLSNQPSVPAIGMRMAVGVIQQRIRNLSRHSVARHNRIDTDYSPEALFRPAYRREMMNDEHMYNFEALLKVLDNFIQDDVWHLYTVEVKGPQVVLTKGIDYRIYKFYENLFEQQEEAAEVISEDPNEASLRILAVEENNMKTGKKQKDISGISYKGTMVTVVGGRVAQGI